MRTIPPLAVCFCIVVACSSPSPTPGAADAGWTTYQVGEASGIETRFLESTAWVPTPEEAFDLRGRCPTITEARARKETSSAMYVEVRGERLGDVAKVGAILVKDRLAVARHQVEADGRLTFPVACEQCTVVLGVDMGSGRVGGCLGTGYSLTFRVGELLAE